MSDWTWIQNGMERIRHLKCKCPVGSLSVWRSELPSNQQCSVCGEFFCTKEKCAECKYRVECLVLPPPIH